MPGTCGGRRRYHFFLRRRRAAAAARRRRRGSAAARSAASSPVIVLTSRRRSCARPIQICLGGLTCICEVTAVPARDLLRRAVEAELQLAVRVLAVERDQHRRVGLVGHADVVGGLAAALAPLRAQRGRPSRRRAGCAAPAARRPRRCECALESADHAAGPTRAPRPRGRAAGAGGSRPPARTCRRSRRGRGRPCRGRSTTSPAACPRRAGRSCRRCRSGCGPARGRVSRCPGSTAWCSVWPLAGVAVAQAQDDRRRLVLLAPAARPAGRPRARASARPAAAAVRGRLHALDHRQRVGRRRHGGRAAGAAAGGACCGWPWPLPPAGGAGAGGTAVGARGRRRRRAAAAPDRAAAEERPARRLRPPSPG